MTSPSFSLVAAAAAAGITTCAVGAEFGQAFEDKEDCPEFVKSFKGETRYNLDTFQVRKRGGVGREKEGGVVGVRMGDRG